MDNKEKVLKRASEMFRTMGVKNITMDNLAADLGMSKRTIYEMFSQKDQLVMESIHYMIMEENAELRKIIDSSEHVVEALFYIIRRKKEHRRTYPHVFVEDIKKYMPKVQSMFFSNHENLKKYSASYMLLEKGTKEGIFRKDIQIELVDNFLHEVISLIHNSQRILALKPEDSALLNSIFIPYFRGLCTPKGSALMTKFFEDLNVLNPS